MAIPGLSVSVLFNVENMKGRDRSEQSGVDRRTISKEILGKQGRRLWTGFIWLRIGSSGRLL
jgi:hypothetical protein